MEFMAGLVVGGFIVTLLFLLTPSERIGGDPLREAREREKARLKFEQRFLGREVDDDAR